MARYRRKTWEVEAEQDGDEWHVECHHEGQTTRVTMGDMEFFRDYEPFLAPTQADGSCEHCGSHSLIEKNYEDWRCADCGREVDRSSRRKSAECTDYLTALRKERDTLQAKAQKLEGDRKTSGEWEELEWKLETARKERDEFKARACVQDERLETRDELLRDQSKHIQRTEAERDEAIVMRDQGRVETKAQQWVGIEERDETMGALETERDNLQEQVKTLRDVVVRRDEVIDKLKVGAVQYDHVIADKRTEIECLRDLLRDALSESDMVGGVSDTLRKRIRAAIDEGPTPIARCPECERQKDRAERAELAVERLTKFIDRNTARHQDSLAKVREDAQRLSCVRLCDKRVGGTGPLPEGGDTNAYAEDAEDDFVTPANVAAAGPYVVPRGEELRRKNEVSTFEIDVIAAVNRGLDDGRLPIVGDSLETIRDEVDRLLEEKVAGVMAQLPYATMFDTRIFREAAVGAVQQAVRNGFITIPKE